MELSDADVETTDYPRTHKASERGRASHQQWTQHLSSNSQQKPRSSSFYWATTSSPSTPRAPALPTLSSPMISPHIKRREKSELNTTRVTLADTTDSLASHCAPSSVCRTAQRPRNSTGSAGELPKKAHRWNNLWMSSCWLHERFFFPIDRSSVSLEW